MNLDTILNAYMVAAEWSTTTTVEDHNGDIDEGVAVDSLNFDWHPNSIATAERLCKHFATAQAANLEDMDPTHIGHDLWLTSAHHGAGFWDRGLGQRGEALSEAARSYECELEVGDDGFIHLRPYTKTMERINA